MNIGQMVGKRADPRSVSSGKLLGNSYFGVEIEMENCAVRDVPSRYWAFKQDGSLRSTNGHSVEAVFSHPYAGLDAEKAIEEMKSLLKDLRPQSSERCGTHIHIDVRDLEEDHYYRFVAAMYFIEPVLFHMFAPERETNAFCLPHYMFVQENKYRGINTRALNDYGSLEVRMYSQNDSVDGLVEKMALLESVKKESVTFDGTDITEKEVSRLLGIPENKIPITARMRMTSSSIVALQYLNDNCSPNPVPKHNQEPVRVVRVPPVPAPIFYEANDLNELRIFHRMPNT